uniref:Uncharacterized protein n=1 Tax=Anopheles atroparvus TaxID=41427 RepID=A0A182JBA4_ANOAO
MDTWLLFSVGFERFESGKWMCVAVSSMIFLIFCLSTLNRSTCRSSGLATPSWAAIDLRSPQSLSTDEISLVVSLGGPPFRKMCLLKDEQEAIIVLRYHGFTGSLLYSQEIPTRSEYSRTEQIVQM